MVSLYDYQVDAVNRLRSGSILCGGVGSGKSITALAFYNRVYGDKKLYIITTAHKRDSFEWGLDAAKFQIACDDVIIDSWNNIKKYTDVKDSFFIFDEQRIVGNGTWVKAFLRIAKNNPWILLSATPGDNWSDYIPVFIANGFYKNRTEFLQKHAVFSRYSKYPKIEKYVGCERLIFYRNSVLIDMKYKRNAETRYEDVEVSYDKDLYLQISRDRWDPYANEPIREIAKCCFLLRKATNSSNDRITKLMDILNKHEKLILFYNFDYEREALLNADWGSDVKIAEWSGHDHQRVPTGKKWIYLVQYFAGAEGWNCITTNVVVFYSLNYSYKTNIQAAGRIDRLNTPFDTLYYYRLVSKAPIDLAIKKNLDNKKDFNEKAFLSVL